MSEAIQINEMQNNSAFTFKHDNRRSGVKEIFFFGKMDGKYAEVFGRYGDMKKFKNPSFIDGIIKVIPETE